MDPDFARIRKKKPDPDRRTRIRNNAEMERLTHKSGSHICPVAGRIRGQEETSPCGQHCRDNVIMFSGHKFVGYWLIALLLIRHRDRDISDFSNIFFSSSIVHVVEKLKNCRVQSFDIFLHSFTIKY